MMPMLLIAYDAYREYYGPIMAGGAGPQAMVVAAPKRYARRCWLRACYNDEVLLGLLGNKLLREKGWLD
jgi:hypothetical protein